MSAQPQHVSSGQARRNDTKTIRLAMKERRAGTKIDVTYHGQQLTITPIRYVRGQTIAAFVGEEIHLFNLSQIQNVVLRRRPLMAAISSADKG